MSVQNALKIIQTYREDQNTKSATFSTLNDLVDLAIQENLPCSKEELKKAFQIDWDMRWASSSDRKKNSLI